MDILYSIRAFSKLSGNSSVSNEHVAKTFRIHKKFPVSIADALTRFFWLWARRLKSLVILWNQRHQFKVFELKDIAKCDAPVVISQNESSLSIMSLNKALRLTIRRVIWILASDTDAVFVNPTNISSIIETAILCTWAGLREVLHKKYIQFPMTNVLRAFHKHAKLSQLS